jgi:hypothetical protein
MVRRFLCLGLMLCLTLALPACSSDSKPVAKPPAVPDPEGGAKVTGPAGRPG